jgi:UDP-glucose 4-epimerase
MSVLITGAGLVGSQIARLEQEAGRTPVIFDFAPRTDALADFIDVDNCVIVRGDVTNPLDLVGAVTANNVTRIIHTAAFGGLQAGSVQAPLTSTMVNTVGTAHVLEIARLLKLERVVLASSSTLYNGLMGGEDNGVYGLEEAYPRPNSIYGANKQAAEDLGRAYAKSYGMDVVAVRYAGVFGPWRPGGGGVATVMLETCLRNAIAGKPGEIKITGMDWIYSKDAALGTHLACWAESHESPLYNLGMGRPYPAEEIVDAINTVTGSTFAAVAEKTASPNLPAMNTDRAHKQLGFEVKFPMDVAIADYRDWIVSTSS